MARSSILGGRPVPFLGEGSSLACHPRVALDAGEADAKGVSSVGFGDTPLGGFDHLAAQVFGVGSHWPMIASGSMFLTVAVGAISLCLSVDSMYLWL